MKVCEHQVIQITLLRKLGDVIGFKKKSAIIEII